MTFKCLAELTEKIEETNRIANLADSMLDANSQLSLTGDLEENRHRRTTANAMTKAALVLLSGYLEGFLKKITEEFTENLNDSKFSIKKAHDDLFLSIFQHSITDNRSKSLSKILNLKNCIVDDIHYPLPLEAIGTPKGNPTVEVIETIFSRIGIPAIIDKLSLRDFALEDTYTTISQSQQLHAKIELAAGGDATQYQRIAEIIDEKWAPKKKRRDVGYVGRIQELLKKRNRIAHGENWGEQVTPTELLEFNRDVLRLCTGIDEILSRELETYIN